MILRKNAMIIGSCWMILSFLLSTLPVWGNEPPKAIDKDAILATSPEWQKNYYHFEVDDGLIETFRIKANDNLEIDVYLGTWCSDSRKNVPGFIKIMDIALVKSLKVKYFDVSRKANKDVKYYVEDLKVERVPTFIVYRDGKEIGRIVENPENSLIEDLIEIIF
jgi:hypothetical protein